MSVRVEMFCHATARDPARAAVSIGHVLTVTLNQDRVENRLLTLPRPLQAGNAEISPNGEWLAYESNESGQDEISVRRMSDLSNWKRQVSTGRTVLYTQIDDVASDLMMVENFR